MKKFKTALNSLKAFIEWKFKKQDVYLMQVNHQFITDYEFYLKTVQQLQHNSAMSNIKKLKKVIGQCVANDWLDKDPFKSYKITTKETHRNFLLKEELEVLINKNGMTIRFESILVGAFRVLLKPVTVTYFPLKAVPSVMVCQLEPIVPHSASSHILTALPSFGKTGFPFPHHWYQLL